MASSSPLKGTAKRSTAGSGCIASPNTQSDKRLTRTKHEHKTHRRSRTGCFTCRLRRKKCDEGKPSCKACHHLSVSCEYKRPSWWPDVERRKKHKELIKLLIKETKLAEKPVKCAASARSVAWIRAVNIAEHDEHTQTRNITPACSVDISSSPSSEIQTPEIINADTPRIMSYPWVPSDFWLQSDSLVNDPTYFDVDIKFDAESFPLDMTAFHSLAIPTLDQYSSIPFDITDLDTFDDIYDLDSLSAQHVCDSSFQCLELAASAPSSDALSRAHQNLIPLPDQMMIPHSDQMTYTNSLSHPFNILIDNCDLHLFTHFISHVARLVFPVVATGNDFNGYSEALLTAMATNKCYLHCCLSAAAQHLKLSGFEHTEQIDHDIMRHRCAAISELCAAFHTGLTPHHFLQAALGMIVFQSAVGNAINANVDATVDAGLPDILWHQHFQAASDVLQNLDIGIFPCAELASSAALAAWIDVLGATMLGRAPIFADTYRLRLECGAPCGLEQLMGCADRIMYLVSEICCLEALAAAGMEPLPLCEHITYLGEQLTLTDAGDDDDNNDAAVIVALTPAQALAHHISALFRLAARVYLCSLVPDSEQAGERFAALVDTAALALGAVPGGPDGHDRCLAWPLLVIGAAAPPASAFRDALRRRAALLGDAVAFGSFGSVVRVLEETWRVNDVVAGEGAGGGSVHWRDVMRSRGWDLLVL